MGKLFQRECRVIVQDKLLEGLDVEFRIDRNLDATQNTADISVYNLSPDNRKALSGLKKVIVQLQAGYKGPSPISQSASAALDAIGITGNSQPPLIFLGELRELTHLRDGSDWVTRISSGDGDVARKSPISFSLGPGTAIENAIRKIAGAMKVGLGNATQALINGKFKDVGSQFIEGVVVHGFAGDELQKLLKSAQLDYSIQNGNLQILPIGGAVSNTAVLLSIGTGLVGSPELGRDSKTGKPQVKVRSLLNAEIFPGRKIKIQSDAINAVFRCDRVAYIGQIRGNDWYCDIEASPVV